jgi:release factor glutamine methyltransferase
MAMAEETWTIGALLTWTTDFLKKKQVSDSPRLDAEVLLAAAQGCKRIELYTSFDYVATDQTRTRFREMVKQRGEGVPVAYIVGHKEFFSLEFEVTRDCLIPRPETEHLVIEGLEFAKRESGASSLGGTLFRVADLCTGSGCVAIAFAKNFPRSLVTASDISEKCLAVAAKNIEKHQLADRVNLLQSDLWGSFETGLEGSFDLVLSNPPYVSTSEYENLAAGVKAFEPSLALIAEDEGMAISKRIFIEGIRFVRVGGMILQETSPMLAEKLTQWLSSTIGWEPLPVKKDLSGKPRIISARRIQ